MIQVNSDLLVNAVLLVVVLSFFLERSLAMIFDHVWYKRTLGSKPGIKELVALASAFGICRFWGFDAYAMVLASDKSHPLGYILTALVIAGGSKASIKLFRDVLGVGKEAAAARTDIRQAEIGPVSTPTQPHI